MARQKEKFVTKREVLNELKKLFVEFKTSGDAKKLELIRRHFTETIKSLPMDKRLVAAKERFLKRDIIEVDQYIDEVRNGNSSNFSKLIAIKHLRPVLVFVRTSDLPMKKRGRKPGAD